MLIFHVPHNQPLNLYDNFIRHLKRRDSSLLTDEKKIYMKKKLKFIFFTILKIKFH